MFSYPIPQFTDLLGLPFEKGGRGPLAWDCYGYVRELFGRTGRWVPDFKTPATLGEIEEIVVRETKPGARWHLVPIGTPGTMLTFRVDGAGAHVGFMLANGRFTHCIEGEGVTTERLAGNWRMRPIASYIYE
jgi:cell wall-associated NlpC family hydrolase